MSGGNFIARIILRLQDEASQGLNNARDRVRGLGQEVERLGPLDNAVKNTFLNIKAYILSAFAVSGIIQFSHKLLDTIRSIQDLGLRLSGLTKSAMDYASSQAYLTNLADRYHKSVSALTGSYASFLALENAGIISRQQSILLLQGFANAAAKTGASQDQMGQSTYGLAQALSTGIVAMEEFKQITEPMPGLANEIAKAFGMTVGELRVLIGTGTVASEEFGRKFVIALKAYEGAAERAGGTISASYADIGNEYNKMAKALEKPVASGLLSLVDVGKSAFGWIRDNSGEIITVLELIAVTLTGKVLSSLSGVTAGYVARYQAETRARASSIALAEADVAQAAGSSVLATENLALAASNIELAQSNLALVQSDLRTEAATLAVTNATIARSRAEVAALSSTVQTTSTAYLLRNALIQLADAEAARSVTLANMAALGRQQAAVSAEIGVAQTAQTKAAWALTAAQMAQEESTLALTAATNTSSVAMGRAATAGKAAFSFIGGWVGVAVIALYGLYTALEKVTGSEEKAAAKAKAFSDAVALSNAEVKKLSESEVDIDFVKTKSDIDEITKKIKAIEDFSWSKVFNLGDLSSQRANLTQTLDVLKQRKDALIAQKNEQIINFDASSLSASELSAALEDTKAKITEIANRVEPLKQQVADGFLSSDAITGDMVLLNAYEAKLSALQAVSGTGVQSQQQLKKAFEGAQESAKSLTAIIDAETKMQTASIEQGLTERLAAIDAMNLSEAQKDTLRVTSKLEAYGLELQLQQQAGAAKLALIDREYQAELAGAANNAARTAEIETQKRQDKLAVYTGLAEYYQGEVNRLGGVYASEIQAAAQAKQQLSSLNQSHEMALFNIKLMGMTEREKLEARESLYAEKMRAVKAERAKGDQADQEKINTLLGDARSLHGQITAAAGNGFEALSRAKSRENQLWEEEKNTLKKNAEQHEENARRAKEAQGEVASKLAETQTSIANITKALNKDYALKIGIDNASLSAAQSTIAALTADATKTITIQTVNAGGGDVPSAPAADAPAAQSTGGPAGQPTGEPWRFNSGGWVHHLGLLPGYGGGDRRRVLAEDGEYIVRKEAVKKVGLPFMALVNAGKVPAGDVIRRALGGPVDPRDWQLVESRLLGIAQAAGRLSSQGVGNSQAIASGQARLNDDIVWKAMTTQVDDLVKRAKAPDIKDEAIDILRMAASEFQRNGAQADMDGIKARIKQMINKRAVKKPQVSTRPVALSMKTLNDALSATPFSNIQEKIQQRASTFSLPVPTLPAQTVVPASQSASSGNMMRVQFVSPDGSKSEGMFNSSDAAAMLRVLKDAGARTV